MGFQHREVETRALKIFLCVDHQSFEPEPIVREPRITKIPSPKFDQWCQDCNIQNPDFSCYVQDCCGDAVVMKKVDLILRGYGP